MPQESTLRPFGNLSVSRMTPPSLWTALATSCFDIRVIAQRFSPLSPTLSYRRPRMSCANHHYMMLPDSQHQVKAVCRCWRCKIQGAGPLTASQSGVGILAPGSSRKPAPQDQRQGPPGVTRIGLLHPPPVVDVLGMGETGARDQSISGRLGFIRSTD